LIDESKATVVGAVLSVLLVAAVVILLRVDLHDLGPSIRVQVYLSHPGPLRTSADVQLGGHKIGRVESVHLVTAQKASDPSHLLYPGGGVVVSVLLRKKYLPWVRGNSEMFVNSKGLVGESYLEIAPPLATEEMQGPLKDGDRIRGVDPARMEEIIVTSFLNAKRFGALLEELRPSTEQLRADLTTLSATLEELAPDATAVAIGPAISRVSTEWTALSATLDAANLPPMGVLRSQSRTLATYARTDFGELSRGLDQLNARMQRVRDRVPEDLWRKFTTVSRDAQNHLARLEKVVQSVEELSQEVQSGLGTIGALMNDKEFSDDAKSLGRYIKRHPWKFLTRPLR